MANILLNYYNFDGDWAKDYVAPYLTGKKVLILPLAFREIQAWDYDSWQNIYGKNGEKYQNIIQPFLAFGIDEEKICWLNCFDKCQNYVDMIQNADVLFFTGGMPEKAIAWMKKLGITDAVKNFGGTVMGASAGAMLQLENYHITPDDDYESYGLWKGLGLVKGLDLEVHYLATDLQNSCTKRAIDDLKLPVYQMWHEGGLIVDGDSVKILGNVNKVE